MTGDIIDLINYRISRSLETLQEAKIMIDNKFWNAAINRMYYACYYVVTALLLKDSHKTGTHKGIRQIFGLHYVQKGIISKEDGRFFSDLFDRRQTGDYDDYILYDENTAVEIFTRADAFIHRVIDVINAK